jgi:hypothetical protein
MKGHENKKKIPYSNHRSWGKNGVREKQMHVTFKLRDRGDDIGFLYT